MEEAAVLEEKKYIFSFIFHKILEKWKKLWKKEIIQSYEKYFYSFSTKYWKNGRSQAKKFTRPIKYSGNVGRMEEAQEEENNSKL